MFNLEDVTVCCTFAANIGSRVIPGLKGKPV